MAFQFSNGDPCKAATHGISNSSPDNSAQGRRAPSGILEHNKGASFIASKYGVTDRHITNLANAGDIPGVKLGTVWRFNEDEVHEALVSRSRTVRKTKANAKGANAK